MAEDKNKKLEGEEQGAKTATPGDQKKTDEKPAKEPGKFKQFFKFFTKHKNKVAAGLGIAGAVGVGVIADRIGIKIGGGKKKADEPGDEQAE